MYGKTTRGGQLPSEFGDLGGPQTFPKRDPTAGDACVSKDFRREETEVEYDSFMDVGDETARYKGPERPRRETLKARTSKKAKPEKGAYPGLPPSESSSQSGTGRAGKLKKKASKLFNSKSTRSDPKRPDMPTTDSASTAAGLSRMQSRSTGTSGDRRDSLTTTSSEFSIASAHEPVAGPSSSHLSLSPPSRRSSHSSARSSARSFFKSRRSSSNRDEPPVPPIRPQGPSPLPLSTNVPLGHPIPVSSSLPAGRDPGSNSLRDWERPEDLGTFTEVPEVITTSATPLPASQRVTSPHNVSASDSQPAGIGGRMSNWFANIIPGTAGTSGVSGNAVPGRGNIFTSTLNEARSSTRPDSIMSANSGPIPTSVSAPGRASFSSMPGDLTSTSTNTSNSSPSRRMNSTTTFLQAARQKAAGMGRWVLDSEALPEGTEPIWILGVEHRYDIGEDKMGETDASNSEEGSWGRQYASRTATTTSTGSPKSKQLQTKRGGSPSPSSLSTNSSGYFSGRTGITIGNLNLTSSPSKKGKGAVTAEGDGALGSPGRGMRSLLSMSKDRDKSSPTAVSWPDGFLQDYRSIIWCTYRAQYAPILSLPADIFLPNPKAYLEAQLPPVSSEPQEILIPSSSQPGPNQGKSSWSWVSSVGAGIGLASGGAVERGLTSDAGWGCMLRTGQCLLANSLIRRHLGRDWRLNRDSAGADGDMRRLEDVERDEASYRQIVSWFLDDPAAVCPFSVHRMALVGKQLGKEIGEWFGPSTAAGAIKTLANAFPACGLGVSAATDGIIFRSDVFAASQTDESPWTPVMKGLPWSDRPRPAKSGFGNKAVLVLVNVRLGTNAVNPIYYDSLKTLFTAPQTVGIAGGRPGSSYYFVGYQGDSLFYLDPHFTRPAIPLRTPAARRIVETQSVPGAVPIMNASTRATDSDAEPILRSREDTTTWLASAYTAEELSTFHCDRVRKMPMSSLDPSMLLGFLIQDHNDWQDFCARMNTVRHKIFSVQDQPPSWSDDDDDQGMESLSETDDGFSLNSHRSVNDAPVEAQRSGSIGSDFVATDDESDLVVSVPHTPTRRRLRPSATETTLNARAMMDDPSQLVMSSSAGTPASQPQFDSSAVLLTKPSIDELTVFEEDQGVMIMADTPPPKETAVTRETQDDTTVKRK